jgi:hypothetical protein
MSFAGLATAAATAAVTAGVTRGINGSPTNNAIKAGGGQGGGQGGMGEAISGGIMDYIKNKDMSDMGEAPPEAQPNFARNPIPAPNNGQQPNQQPTQNFTPVTGNQFSPVAQTPSRGFGRPQDEEQPNNIQGFISHLFGGGR